jgi:hypothetical protein
MSYETRVVGGTVEVTSPRTDTVYSYEIPPGTSPAAYSLRCAERARVSECLAASGLPAGERGLGALSDQVREAEPAHCGQGWLLRPARGRSLGISRM